VIQVTPRDTRRTVIVFSGMAPRNHIFEWTASFSDFPVNLIGVRDPDDKWYQTIFSDTIAHLRTVLAGLETRHLLCLGGSAGGFAALVFGAALGADRIVAFCPQSACGERKRALGDHRWPEMCLSTPAADIAGNYPGAEIHCALDDDLDVMHAARLNAPTLMWPAGGHDLPFALKRDGMLEGILREAIR
jgi:hypothetical protein